MGLHGYEFINMLYHAKMFLSLLIGGHSDNFLHKNLHLLASYNNDLQQKFLINHRNPDVYICKA